MLSCGLAAVLKSSLLVLDTKAVLSIGDKKDALCPLTGLWAENTDMWGT